jgi:signal transduction histidine kinase
VPEEQGRAIFDLYFTTRAEGTGLGLPLVQRFAAQHGGRVELRESQGGGATFILSLECEA